MANLNLLSDKDVATLREMVHWFRTFRPRDTEEQVDHQHQAPETYVALPQDVSGIPAITSGASPSSGDMPGSAQCNIYQINQYGELVSTSTSKTVYNLFAGIIPQGFIPVSRDKFGRWLALPSSPGVYVALPAFQITPLSHVGSATVNAAAGDIPGSGNCSIYELVSGSLTLSSLSTITVYNLSEVLIERRWIVVMRDVFGTFWVPPAEAKAATLYAYRSFVGTSVNYIAQGLTGLVSGNPNGSSATVIAKFGNIQHNVDVFVSWDWEGAQWVGVQIACPTGTAT